MRHIPGRHMRVVEQPEVAQVTGDVSEVGVASQRINCRAEESLGEQIIGVERHDVAAGSRCDSGVAGSGQPGVGLAHLGDADEIVENLDRLLIGRAVIDDHDFDVRIARGAHGVDRTEEEVPLVEERYDN